MRYPLELVPLDRVVRSVWRALSTDPTLSGIFPGSIFRYSTYTPSKMYGKGSRLIVAPLQLTQAGAFSHVWKGELSVAVVHEFTAAQANLHVPEDQASEITLLTYIRDFLHGVGPNLLDVPGDADSRLKCIRNKPRFETIAWTPQPVDNSDELAFFVAIVAIYETVEDAPRRFN